MDSCSVCKVGRSAAIGFFRAPSRGIRCWEERRLKARCSACVALRGCVREREWKWVAWFLIFFLIFSFFPSLYFLSISPEDFFFSSLRLKRSIQGVRSYFFSFFLAGGSVLYARDPLCTRDVNK